MNLTEISKEILGSFLEKIESPILVDATCGNGFDTLFLAKCAQNSGKVFAFDVQESAVENTRRLLAQNSALKNAEIFRSSHEFLKEKIPQEYFGKINAAMFNLGWLPKSDKKIITKPESTLKALRALAEIADKNQNLISVLAYPAHEGGRREYCEVEKYAAQFSPQVFKDAANPDSPALFIFKIS